MCPFNKNLQQMSKWIWAACTGNQTTLLHSTTGEAELVNVGLEWQDMKYCWSSLSRNKKIMKCTCREMKKLCAIPNIELKWFDRSSSLIPSSHLFLYRATGFWSKAGGLWTMTSPSMPISTWRMASLSKSSSALVSALLLSVPVCFHPSLDSLSVCFSQVCWFSPWYLTPSVYWECCRSVEMMFPHFVCAAHKIKVG